MNNDTSKSSFNSIEEIQIEKEIIKQKMAAHSNRIKELANDLMTPSPATNKVEFIMNTAQRSFAVIDGIRVGYKLMQRFGFFRKKATGRKFFS